jgi:DNA-directed RNA polymerase sigma subunit (sigma70/sigma32)
MERTLVSRTSALKEYLGVIANLPRLDEAAQEALGRRLASGEHSVLAELTESFLPYVVAEATAVRGRGVRFEALIAAGNRGLAQGLRDEHGPLKARVERGVRQGIQEALGRCRRR